MRTVVIPYLAFGFLFAVETTAQEQDTTSIESVAEAPPRAEGEGPFSRLILRGATLIDGTGAPPVGPVDVVAEENPLANLKVLYGTGAIKLDEANQPARVGGVRYTIKDGIVYDAKSLLADVRAMVAQAKSKGATNP